MAGDVETRAREIADTARQHGGRFHLPRSGAEGDRAACRYLVNNGFARWLVNGPGIALTGKSWPVPPPEPEPMSLGQALSILARVHTRDADGVGFEVMMAATPDPWVASLHEYTQAWGAVRSAVGLVTDTPPPSPR